jgi:hypothetical protein
MVECETWSGEITNAHKMVAAEQREETIWTTKAYVGVR